MSVFWLKRMKQEQRDDSSWALPYGDLMCLLLAVFVMIAGMSELRSGERFEAVGSAVRSAFGFAPAPRSSASEAQRRLTLIDQLERAGLRREGTQRAPDEQALGACDVLTEPDRLVIRVAGPVSFEPFSAQLQPAGERAIARIAEYLVSGRAFLEVRGHGGDGVLPPDAPFRDELDLSYARARVVVDALCSCGVARDRVCVSAWGDNDPLTINRQAGTRGANRYVEIIVHAAMTAAHVQVVAEKERV